MMSKLAFPECSGIVLAMKELIDTKINVNINALIDKASLPDDGSVSAR
jgi:hypothetical protein